jgi:elongation factor P--beta-lysine ligase
MSIRQQSPLARLQRDPRLAERFELYVCGVELANGFGEPRMPLSSARLEQQMAEKERVYGARYPLDEELAALALMPQASGVALGFDRLVMLATGAQDRMTASDERQRVSTTLRSRCLCHVPRGGERVLQRLESCELPRAPWKPK